MIIAMDDSPFHALPDELLESIVFYLDPAATLAFGASCKRGNKIAYENLLWRKHCVETWNYWQPSHNLPEKLEEPPAQVKWRQLYNARRKTDSEASEIFEELLKMQQFRIQRIEELAERGYDVKDLFLQLRDETPDEAADVLARRYFADAVLGQIHRRTALEKWTRLSKGQMVRLEEVLGAYDLFVLGGRKGDLVDIDREFDRIAAAVKAGNEEFEGLGIRQKAIQVADYLRSNGLVGNPVVDDYHNLRNNFISIALFDEPHTSLPLQSVAIYCAVARKLGINARPSNYPGHVHAVIEAPSNVSLNGAERTPPAPGEDHEPEIMHMDPWHSSNEISRDDLTLRLSQMGAPAGQHRLHVAATTLFEMAIRTGRNIMHSVQEARVCTTTVAHYWNIAYRLTQNQDRQRATTRRPAYPDIEAAWYSMLWSMMILGDNTQASTLHRRRQCLPYLAEHFQQHFPEDLGLVQSILAPMFVGEREHTVLMHMVMTNRAGDRVPKVRSVHNTPMFAGMLRQHCGDFGLVTNLRLQAPCPREGLEKKVVFGIGMLFQHKRYGYEGIITGWDIKCEADPRWMHQMRVDDLPRGREQPFYNIV